MHEIKFACVGTNNLEHYLEFGILAKVGKSIEKQSKLQFTAVLIVIIEDYILLSFIFLVIYACLKGNII